MLARLVAALGRARLHRLRQPAGAARGDARLACRTARARARPSSSQTRAQRSRLHAKLPVATASSSRRDRSICWPICCVTREHERISLLMWDETPSLLAMVALVAIVVIVVILVFAGIGYAFGRLIL